jgi:bifunctional ADP-heptose synthase (sugar kinase/adenylyltransferase)
VFTWREREAMLSALKVVDAVTLHVDLGSTLRIVKPDIYVKGIEYDGALIEEGLCRDLGIEIVFLDTRPVYSSTDILSGKLLNDRIRLASERGR